MKYLQQLDLQQRESSESTAIGRWYERRKQNLSKDDSGKPVDHEESEPKLEDDEDEEFTEQNYENSWHEVAPLSPRQQFIHKARIRNSNSDHHNFSCKKKGKKK
jgi:hypothetical protein